MLGGNGLRTALTDAGLTVKEDENVDYVVIGLDEAVTYEKLAIATLAVRKGAKFISTNPDVSIPKERGFLPEMELLQVWLVYLLDNSHNLLVNQKPSSCKLL